MSTNGWRRIGVIVPSSNTIVESDFARSLPAGVTLHTSRMFLAETTEPAQRRMLSQYLPQAIEDIASLRPHVVVFACTTAGAMLGAAGEAQLIQEIGERAAAPVVSMNDAVNSCIAGYAPRSVAVITPYVEELNQHIRRSLEGRGITVAHIAGLGITENFTTAEIPPEEIVAYAASQLEGVDFDLLYVPCANFRAYEARPALADRFRVPVVTSDSATIEAALAAINLSKVAA
jgi:maleate isomerase